MAQLLQSSPLQIEKDLLRTYAEVTEDWNPLHLDEEFASRTPIGGIIAHGTLSLNLILRVFAECLGLQALPGAILDVRFIKPVRLGDRVTGYARVMEASKDSYDVWVESNDETRVIEGTLIVPQANAARES